MSASLVGSEMCIRDRSTKAGFRTSSEAGAADRGSRPPPAASGMPGPEAACLLYTSDAADDM
eukprot:1545725-Alexandrium_andersonii.AAC.1